MVKLTDTETHLLLDQLDHLFEDDPHVNFIRLEQDEDGDDYILIGHQSPDTSKFQNSIDFTNGNSTTTLSVKVEFSDPFQEEIAPNNITDYAYDYISSDCGLAGTRIWNDSGWGTASMSARGLKLEVTRSGRVIHRCERSGPTIASNAHVMKRGGLTISFEGGNIGVCECLFDLNHGVGVDYGHLAWGQNVRTENYLHVFMPNSPSRKERVYGAAVFGHGFGVGKQGARTGWTTGYVGNITSIRLQGYNGSFRCRKASYASAPGDSGSAILCKINNQWKWGGIHFASGPHFLSWDSVSTVAENKATQLKINIDE